MNMEELAPGVSSPRVVNKTPITIANEQLNAMQRRVALITVIVPVLGLLVAIGLLWSTGQITLVEIGLLLVMYTLTLLGITVGFHRHFAHRAFQAKLPVRILLGILGSMAAQGPVVYWVSTHRRHHSHSDQEGDPHSPHLHEEGLLGALQGLWYAHIGWLFHAEMTNSAYFAKELLRDPVVMGVNKRYFTWILLGLLIPALVDGLWQMSCVGALQGLLWGGLVRIFLVHHATWSINSITHLYGRRPFATRDHSTNNVWLAIPTLGEAWHNNHHAFPGSAIFGLERRQIDIGAWVIQLLEITGGVWDVHRPATETIAAKKGGQPGF
jgi:stearoyl-CoA desaturase (Delta-9 desaturase)